MKRLFSSLTMIPLLLLSQHALAEEEGFLRSLAGNWSGQGTVKPRINMSPINLTCNFETQARGTALSMNGACRGLILIRRSIGADLRAAGGRYSGTYIGPAGGRSALSGNREGNVIRLAIRWSKDVNGDRSANMIIRKVGNNGLNLSTIDRDPATGKTVVTSEIDLQRR
jgi:hypothetical protein